MSHLPTSPISPGEERRIMEQMYLLMGKQVQSYHKHRHMGNNSSVRVELAQELMESMEYTLGLVGGAYAHANVEEALHLGQGILERKVEQAKSMLDLVNATAPQWQTECRWETLRYLHHYLDHYDYLHLSQKSPEVFYPLPIAAPETSKGIDLCLFYLDVMWSENQIMGSFEDATLEAFWNRLPADTMNQCEPLIINGIGKVIISDLGKGLTFTEVERKALQAILSEKPVKETAVCSAHGLSRWLNLSEKPSNYLQAVAVQMVPLLEVAMRHGDLSVLFV